MGTHLNREAYRLVMTRLSRAWHRRAVLERVRYGKTQHYYACLARAAYLRRVSR
jgi:hypothetical protein